MQKGQEFFFLREFCLAVIQAQSVQTLTKAPQILRVKEIL